MVVAKGNYTESSKLRSANKKILHIRRADFQNDGFLRSTIKDFAYFPFSLSVNCCAFGCCEIIRNLLDCGALIRRFCIFAEPNSRMTISCGALGLDQERRNDGFLRISRPRPTMAEILKLENGFISTHKKNHSH